jgi:broad specificity phosphatase PhoE
MSKLLLIRHGLTPWNEDGRIQGHRDIPLSARGRAELSARRIPLEYRHFHWYASPLARAMQSARLLGARDLKSDARLVELNWGAWQGCTRAELRERDAEAFAENEARGLDFRAPGGESPGELRRRFQAWLEELCESGRPAIAVTHKGVIQMALAMATGWDLVSRAPTRLDWRCGQLFSVAGPPARLQVQRLNVALEAHAAAPDEAEG